ncbi:hypothetical protein WN944_011682 [Citrus x changshan-huyou]|uniref:Uncharacterized protein n=3 Tax=Citrus TaxID=2706 RepID=A0ACB8NC48_CITSI|nr:uncharacterized protein LOC102618664 [Citrus sinensis]KAH9746820.1 hypothetical protein KPL70_004536 [Citrus sinensis]KAH9795170.1 hypothetical protein KPL71_005139 [Citrus sinensis]KDO76991.1 hypothetical protein CISIN_1g030181mg [Citrus sinensis]
MKQCLIQQNSIASLELEEMRSSVSDRRDYMVCPKPRRLGLLNGNLNDQPPVRSLRLNFSHQAESFDSKSGTDLFDIILPKGGYGGVEMEQPYNQVLASSPPFFCGSPPSRVANPLIHDSRFGDEEITPFSPILLPQSPSSSTRKGGAGGGCVRPNFGNKPAVRVEGFDCRDRQNCSIPALA